MDFAHPAIVMPLRGKGIGREGGSGNGERGRARG